MNLASLDRWQAVCKGCGAPPKPGVFRAAFFSRKSAATLSSCASRSMQRATISAPRLPESAKQIRYAMS
jgi:hypothetical protein